MPVYLVSVEKMMHTTGTVKVVAKSAEAAVAQVNRGINNGSIQTEGIDWDDPVYEDCSFRTTDDVEEA